MIPNDFGLIRQRDHTLMACLFPLIKDISEYYIELVYVKPEEWNLGYFYSTNTGTLTEEPLMKCAVIDISKYEYVLAPISCVQLSRSIFTGLSVRGESLNMLLRGTFTNTSHPLNAYILFERSTSSLSYVAINEKMEDNLPIIGFMRHRSDEVNPKGIIKDVNSDLLQPVKEDELNGEADRERNDLPGNAKSSDLDSKSGSGADERANS